MDGQTGNGTGGGRRPGRGLRPWAVGVLKVAVTGGILWALAASLDAGRLRAVLAGVSVAWLLPALAVKAAGILSSVLRWRWLLRGQGLEVPLRALVGSFLVGRFIGIVVPGTVGLDAWRAYDIARHAHAPARSIAVILVEKVIGFFALGLLVLATLPGGRRFLPPEALGVLAGVFLLPVAIAFYLLVRPGAVEWLSDRLVPRAFGLRRRVGRAAAAAGAYARQRGLLAAATGFGLLVHLCTASMYLFTARAVGADVAASDILFVAPLMIVATVVPVSLSGFGVREGTFAFLLAQVGVPVEQSVVLGFLGFLAGEIYSVLGGVAFLARGRRYDPGIADFRAGVRAGDLREAPVPSAGAAPGSADPV